MLRPLHQCGIYMWAAFALTTVWSACGMQILQPQAAPITGAPHGLQRGLDNINWPFGRPGQSNTSGDVTSFSQGGFLSAVTPNSSLASLARRTRASSIHGARDVYHLKVASNNSVAVVATGAHMNATSSTTKVEKLSGAGPVVKDSVTGGAARVDAKHPPDVNESHRVGNMTAGNGSVKWIVPNRILPAKITSLDMSAGMNKLAVIASRVSLGFTLVIFILFCYCLEGHEDCILCFRCCTHLGMKTQGFMLLFCLLNLSIFVTLWAVKILRPMLLMLVLLCGFGSLCCTCWFMIILEIYRKVHQPVEELYDAMHYMHDKIDHVLHFLGLEPSSHDGTRPSLFGRLKLVHRHPERKESKPKEAVARPSLFKSMTTQFTRLTSERDSQSSAAGPHLEQEAEGASHPRQWHMPGVRHQAFKQPKLPRSTTK